MISLGFDVAKDSVVVVMTDASHSLKSSATVTNTEQALNAYFDNYKDRSVHATCESTGVYHLPLARVCLTRDIPLYLLNPITTKQFTKATVRRRKTDLTDAHIIAKLGLQKAGTLVSQALFSDTKSLTRTAHKLEELRQAVIRLEQHVETVLENHQECHEALLMSIEHIQHARDVFRTTATYATNQDILTLLCSITGIGKALGPVIVSEIGDIARFQRPEQLIAFAGLDPRVKQSGVSLNRMGRLTKRGSPHLRHAFFVAASVARRYDPELKSYYEKKRLEGKRYTEATIATARKVAYRVFAVWKRRTPYVRS